MGNGIIHAMKTITMLLFTSWLAVFACAGSDLAFTLKTALPDGSDVTLVKSADMKHCQEKAGCITWTGHPLLGASFKATATLKPSPGGLEWGFEYSGNDSGRLIEEVSFHDMLRFARELCDDDQIVMNKDVYNSEMATCSRNRAIAYLLESKGIIQTDVEDALQFYT